MKQSHGIYNYTGLPTKDETLETIVRFLNLGFLVCINCAESFNKLSNTYLNSETKRQASNRHNLRVLGRLYSLIPCG